MTHGSVWHDTFMWDRTHGYEVKPVTLCQPNTRTKIHTYIQTYTRAHVHTYIHAYIHTYTHTYIHTYIHTYMHTHTHTDIVTYIHTYMHACIQTYMRTYMHTHRHTIHPLSKHRAKNRMSAKTNIHLAPKWLHLYLNVLTPYQPNSHIHLHDSTQSL